MKDKKSHFFVSAFVVLLALAFIWPTTFVSQGVSAPSGQASEATLPPSQAPRFVQPATPRAPGLQAISALAQPVVTPDPTVPDATHAEIARKISAVIGKAAYRRADWGIDIRSIEDDSPVFSYNAEKLFAPASNAKLFTTATALVRLGSNFRFQTRVVYEGTLRPDRKLVGDLVIIGQGDPDLSGTIRPDSGELAHLDEIAARVREAGVDEIEGDVIGDDAYFVWAPYGEGWTASDLTRNYGAPVSALTFNENMITLSIRPGARAGLPGAAFVYPAESLLKIINNTRTVTNSRRNSLSWYRKPGTDIVTVSGRVSKRTGGASCSFLVRDPALYTAALFRERLIRAGIRVQGTARSRHSGDPTTPRWSQLLYAHESPPLLDILAFTNKKSQNLFAEILLRTLGAQVKGEGSDQAGLEVVYDFLKEAGVTPSDARLYDGSGLSRYSMITPRAETLLLNHMAAQPNFSEFVDTLAIAGLDGTLRGRMVHGPAFQRVFAKTGSLQNVTTLGGYVRTESGKTLSFSILSNHRYSSDSAKRAIDQICAVLAKM